MHFEYSMKLALLAQVAYETMRDHIDKIVVYLPNIVGMKILERRDTGNSTYIVSHWQGKHVLPDIIGQIIKVPDMAWIDRAEWQNDKQICSWSYEPFVFKDYIKMRGTDTFTQEGNETLIAIQGDIDVNFLHYPLIPTVLKTKINEQISNILYSLVEPNFVTIYKGLEKYVHANSGGK